jgi:crotonobetainyl-CoA:carnitine CoA-transferase CaiB-like acyl-CoA transferase
LLVKNLFAYPDYVARRALREENYNTIDIVASNIGNAGKCPNVVSAVGRKTSREPAARFDLTPSTIRKLAPMLGADNRSILDELGYSLEDIERLTINRVLHQQPAK